MKFENRRRCEHACFCDIDENECFLVDGNSLYMKIHPITTMHEIKCNAINLETGILSRFVDYRQVEPVSAKVVIE